MKYSSSLLKKFIAVNDTPQAIAKNLILKTCEIEEVEERLIPETIVIGKVTSCEKHPDADKLSVCQVNCGDKGNFQILCGGSNVRVDILVPVALAGTYFPKADITIQPRKMRGMDSNGMICSKEELGINEDMELHSIRDMQADLDDLSDADIGTPLARKYPRLEGYILDVDSKSLTNRPDLTGHFGIAAELNAMYDAQQISFNRIPALYEQFHSTNILEVLEHSTPAQRKVQVQTPAATTYTLLEINKVQIQASSFFTRLQLLEMGSAPRNNWVDFSNLFMIISGQPVHFFDAAKVDGDIIVRQASEGEQFTDLFGSVHSLQASDMVIADKSKILALAGIVGGLDSGISENTQDILVEIAHFDPVVVRKTGTRLGLRTDAELRYEKHINPRWSAYCLLLLLDELKYYQKDLGSFALGGVAYYISDTLEAKNKKQINVDISKMEHFIFGQEQKDFGKKASNWLEKLGFTLSGKTTLTLTPPLWRSPDDINITEDIYEEVARMSGYDEISPLPVNFPITHTAYTPLIDIQRKIEDILVRNFACDQTESYPWIGDKAVSLRNLDPAQLYILQNPVNPEAPYLRNSMAPGLLNHIIKNHKFFDTCKIFDLGKVWKKWIMNNEQWIMNKYASAFVNEETELGIMLYQKDVANWDHDPLLQAKDMVRTLLRDLWLTGTLEFVASQLTIYHPKKQAELVYQGITIGHIATLHPLLLSSVKLPETAAVVSISLNLLRLVELLAQDAGHRYTFETLQDQIVWRDLCFVIDADQSFDAVLSAVRQVPEISGLEVFDVYAGKTLGEGKKSVSIKIKISGDTSKDAASMTTEHINAIMEAAIKAAGNAGGQLRG